VNILGWLLYGIFGPAQKNASKSAESVSSDIKKESAYKIAAGNRHRAFSFDRVMKVEHLHCSQRQAPAAVPEFWCLNVKLFGPAVCHQDMDSENPDACGKLLTFRMKVREY
jgi:hypothetical protein